MELKKGAANGVLGGVGYPGVLRGKAFSLLFIRDVSRRHGTTNGVAFGILTPMLCPKDPENDDGISRLAAAPIPEPPSLRETHLEEVGSASPGISTVEDE